MDSLPQAVTSRNSDPALLTKKEFDRFIGVSPVVASLDNDANT